MEADEPGHPRGQNDHSRCHLPMAAVARAATSVATTNATFAGVYPRPDFSNAT
jgi:hypothetical protein